MLLKHRICKIKGGLGRIEIKEWRKFLSFFYFLISANSKVRSGTYGSKIAKEMIHLARQEAAQDVYLIPKST